MNTYTGTFNNKDWYQVSKNGKPFSAKKSLRHVQHSPDGFSWGYGGSGPAQLAFGILLEETGDPHIAMDLYMEFKADVISRLPRESFTLTGDQVSEWLASQKDEKTAERWDGLS